MSFVFIKNSHAREGMTVIKKLGNHLFLSSRLRSPPVCHPARNPHLHNRPSHRHQIHRNPTMVILLGIGNCCRLFTSDDSCFMALAFGFKGALLVFGMGELSFEMVEFGLSGFCIGLGLYGFLFMPTKGEEGRMRCFRSFFGNGFDGFFFCTIGVSSSSSPDDPVPEPASSLYRIRKGFLSNNRG